MASSGEKKKAVRKPHAKKGLLTAERLRELLSYDPTTGEFRWRTFRGRLAKAGDLAGTLKPSGYVDIFVDCERYAAHRLAWLHVHGRWPADRLDHINGKRSDNRIGNLRACNATQNSQNKARYKSNTSGHTGVCWHKPNRKWVARISAGGRKRCLGYFADKRDAAEAYAAGKARLHSFQPISRGQ